MTVVNVIGGGLAGMTVAYGLARLGWRVRVLESGHAPGGLCGNVSVGGHLVERYYHHVFKSELEVQSLIHSVGLWSDFRWQKVHHARTLRLVERAETMQDRASSVRRVLREGRFFAALVSCRDIRLLDSLTALEWLGKYFKPAELDDLWIPLLRKKFGRHYDVVSAWWMADRLTARLSSTNPFTRTETIGYLRGGFGRLVSALLDHVPVGTVELVRNITVTGFQYGDAGIVRLFSTGGDIDATGPVISTVPRPVLLSMSGFIRDVGIPVPPYMSCLCHILLTGRPLSDNYWISAAADEPFCAVVEQSKLFDDGPNVVYLPDYLENPSRPDDSAISASLAGALDVLPSVVPGFELGDVISTGVSFDSFCQPVFVKGHLSGRSRPFRAASNLWITDPYDDYPNQTRGMAATVRRAFSVVEAIGGP